MQSTRPITLPGYHLTDKLYDGSRSAIYRGWRLADGQAVAVKVPHSRQPSLTQIAHYRNQYAISERLAHCAYTVRSLALERYGEGFALVMEAVEGMSLADYRGDRPVPLGRALAIAVQLGQALAEIHQAGAIHKDIKPHNVLISADGKTLKVADFGISSLLLTGQRSLPVTPYLLEGTLAYLAPEQTGRTNHAIDYRTDFYGFGVSLFELLTGRLPFETPDPLELVHCHLARVPPPPSALVPALPPVVDAIVLKLLAKNPADRYQSARSLGADLDRCHRAYGADGTIAAFAIAQGDRPDCFSVPDGPYGRQAEGAQLRRAFARVAAGEALWVAVTGPAGVGKTALVNGLHRELARTRGYFIRGKFDQYRSGGPFGAITAAFQELVQHLLAETPERVNFWRAKLCGALGPAGGRALIDLVPDLGRLMGPMAPVAPEPPPSGQAARRQLLRAFGNLATAIAGPDRPLVLFLDDLQWADRASIALLHTLLVDLPVPHLLAIGAYRDREVAADAQGLGEGLRILATEGRAVMVRVAPLGDRAVATLLCEALGAPRDRVEPLRQLVSTVTGGNPFFIRQLLMGFHGAGILTPRAGAAGWDWDLNRARRAAVTEDAIAWLTARLAELPPATGTLLQVAACLGNSFDLALLAAAVDQPLQTVAAALWPALEWGYVLPVGDLHRFFIPTQTETAPLAPALERQMGRAATYQFVHDRVQQAAWASLPPPEQAALQLLLGRRFEGPAVAELADRPDGLFLLVNQFNGGRALLTAPRDRLGLAALNLEAGQRAKGATAFDLAANYLTLGCQLLGPEGWREQPVLARTLHEEAAEAAYLAGDLAAAAALLDRLGPHLTQPLERVRMTEVAIAVAVARHDLTGAIALALAALAQLGRPLPADPTPADVAALMDRVQTLPGATEPEQLLTRPPMVDPVAIAAVRLISSIFNAAFVVAPNLFAYGVLTIARWSMAEGNLPLSAFAYANYGGMLCALRGERPLGYRFGQMALALVAQLGARSLEAKVYEVVGCFVNHWRAPARAALPLFSHAYGVGLETGDLEFAALSRHLQGAWGYLVGEALDALDLDLGAAIADLESIQQAAPLTYASLYHQVVADWRTVLPPADGPQDPQTEPWQPLQGDRYDGAARLAAVASTGDRYERFSIHAHRMVLHYHLGDLTLALEACDRAAADLDAVQRLYLVPWFQFHGALVHLEAAADPHRPEGDRAGHRHWVHQALAALHPLALDAPENFQHQWDLLEAERLALDGDPWAASEAYDRAIDGAITHQNPYAEALALERAGRFYLTRDRQALARTYLTQACYGYARWGAHAKVHQLQQRYDLPDLLDADPPPQHNPLTHRHTTSSGRATAQGQWLDWNALVKASQAISESLVFEECLAALMEVMLTNTGAETGALVLCQGEQLRLRSRCCPPNSCEILDLPLAEATDLPQAIICYSYHTGGAIILDSAHQSEQFAQDPAVLHRQIESVLCMPLIKQGEVRGLVYLENNLAPRVFADDRLEGIRLLCSQAAISLENASLYHKLEYETVHDALTGLPNRTWFAQRLQGTIARSRDRNPTKRPPPSSPKAQDKTQGKTQGKPQGKFSQGDGYVVFLLDLDRFKTINDTLRHSIGDELLKQVAHRLRRLYPQGHIARLGGDEFALLMEGLTDPPTITHQAERLVAAFRTPFQLNEYEIYATASVGLVTGDPTYRQPDDLLKDAEVAMYRAKGRGGNGYTHFDPTMQTSAVERLQLETDLRRTLHACHGELRHLQLYYQPILDLRRDRVVSFEALVRWQHPDRGWISPSEFIPIAEETGIIAPLGWLIFRDACRQLARWQRQFPHLGPLSMNVNLSALQLCQVNLVERIAQVLKTTGIAPGTLKLEITESALFEDFESQVRVLRRLRERQIRICIDDFGTGYSSLSRLHEFPIDTLKIDRAFIQQVGQQSGDRVATVRTILMLARSLGMDVVAEGIETPEQLSLLRSLGCDYGQGFLFAQPLPADRAEAFLQHTF